MTDEQLETEANQAYGQVSSRKPPHAQDQELDEVYQYI